MDFNAGSKIEDPDNYKSQMKTGTECLHLGIYAYLNSFCLQPGTSCLELNDHGL